MYRSWVRDSDIIKSSFKVLGDKWIALKDTKIYFPVSYEEAGMAILGDSNLVLGIVAIRVDGIYGVLSVNAKVNFTPSLTNTVTMDNEPYYEMVFEKGSEVIDNINVIKDDVLVYHIFDLFFSKARIPWYINYNDLCSIFNTAPEYAGINIGSRPEIIHLLVSLIARDKNDRNKYYRQIISGSLEDKNRLAYVGIRNVEFGASTTLTRLGGNYFQTGVVSSLLYPTEKVENIESILRY